MCISTRKYITDVYIYTYIYIGIYLCSVLIGVRLKKIIDYLTHVERLFGKTRLSAAKSFVQ